LSHQTRFEPKLVLPLDSHLGQLDRVLNQERVLRLLHALQRRREAAEGRAFSGEAR
jgi:hypothetical protein